MGNTKFNSVFNKSDAKPVVLAEVAFSSGTQYFSLTGVRTSTQYYESRMLTSGQVSRALHRHASLFETGVVTLELANTDGEMTKILFNEIIKDMAVTLKVGTTDMPFGDFVSIAAGVIDDYSLKDMVIRMVVKDSFVSLPEFPDTGKVNTNDSSSVGYFPNAWENEVGKPLPVLYGTHSVSGTPTDYRDRGKVPAILIDITTDAQKFLIARHAVKTIDEVYVWTPEKGNTLLTSGTDYDAYKAGTLNSTTMAYIQAKAGKFGTSFQDSNGNLGIVSINVTGVEDVGDGTGTLLDEPIEVLEHFLANYLGNPTIDTTTFAAVETICQNRSYVCAGGYIEDTPTQDVMANFLKSFDLKMYVKGDGSLALNILSPDILVTGSEVDFKEHVDILEWEVHFYTDYEAGQQDKVINAIAYEFDLHLARANFQGAGEASDATSVSDYGEQKISMTMPWTTEAATANDVAQRIINRFKSINAVAVFTTSLKGLQLELGEAIRLTHVLFPSRDAEGCKRRYFQVAEVNADLDNGTVSIVAPDVNHVLSGGFLLGDETTMAATWLQAEGTSDEVFGYLCDRSTGQFSNGTAGKVYL